jgi:PAS domain S-box-containing protein
MEISPFLNNASLLLALSILSTYLRYRWVKEFRLKEPILGVLYGLFTVIAMFMPMTLTPGVFFDGRSIILGLAGLFESPFVALIAVFMGSAYRIHLGGIGAFTGVGSMVISACAGLLLKELVARKKVRLNPWTLLAFGFTIHLLLIFWFFTFPLDLALRIIKTIAFPYLVIFTITTMMIGLFMLSQQQRLVIEKNLAESEKKYRELVDTMMEGIWMVDQNELTTFVNPTMAAMLGYSPEEIIGQSILSFLKKGLHNKLQQFFERRKQGLSDRYDIECLHKDGHSVSFSVATTPIYDTKGGFAGSLAAMQDITDRKKAEQLLERQSKHLEEMVEERTKDLLEAQTQLMRAEKMVTLGELAGSVGHELRNPLAVIRNSVYLLKTAKNDESKRNEYTNLIELETHNASQIITDLLDYSRIQPLKPISCDAADLVAEVIERNPPPANIKLVSQISRGLPKIMVNPQQIGQILVNLVINAYEAMPQGGPLEIAAEKKKDKIFITIKDSGVGILKKDFPKLFEPLFTTKPRGIGLGLAISRRLADLNHSEISVKSQVEKGTTFSLAMPITLDQPKSV